MTLLTKSALALLSLAALAQPARAERVVLVAGGGDRTDAAPAREAKLIAPFGIDFTSGGDAFLVELTGQRVLKLSRDHMLCTVAGAAEQQGTAGDGGPGSAARFNGMHSLAVAPDGTVYLADTWNNRIRKLNPRTGTISAVAGTGEKGDQADGAAAEAQLGGIYCIDLNASGKLLYLADLDNRRIRVLDLARGTLKTVAGNGQKGVPQDGAVAVDSPLVDPRAVAVDSQGNIYILARAGHAMRVVDPQGKIRTVIGTSKRGLSGDGGPATQATLNGPKHLCIDPQDNVIIADTENHVIRKYLPKEGTIVRIAGSGKRGTSGIGGPPEQLQMNQPHGVCLHRSGELYIVDSSNHRVLKIEK